MANVKALDAELEAILAGMNISDAEKGKIRKAKASEGRSRRTSEEELLKEYPHAIPGTLGFDTAANKQFMQIRCQHPGCEATRRVNTSDLFQVKVCEPHKKAQREEAKKARTELLAKFKAAQEEAKKKAAEAPAAETPAPEVETEVEAQ